MSESAQPIKVEPVVLRDVADALHQTRIFAGTPIDSIRGVENVERVIAKTGAVLVENGQPWLYYWLVIEGEVRAERPESDGTWTLGGVARAGEGFGEAPF